MHLIYKLPAWFATRDMFLSLRARIANTGDMALALVAFGLLMYWKVSPLYVVIVAAIGGAALGAFLQT